MAQTSSWPAAMSMARRELAASVPTVTKARTPAWRAASEHRIGVVAEVAVAVGPGRSPGRGRRRAVGCPRRCRHQALRGNSAAPFSTASAARVRAPGRRLGQALVGHLAAQPDALPDGLRRFGHRRRHQHGGDAQRLQGVAQHGVDGWAGLGLPRLVGFEMGVGGAQQPPGGGQRVGRLDRGPGRGRIGVGAGGDLGQRAVRPGCRPDAVALAAHHRGHPGQEVAEVVGQVGVVARHHRLVREVAVGPEGEVGQEVVAEAVHPEVGDEVGRGDLVQARLRHLLAADEEEAVDVDLLGRGQAGRQQHRRPVDAVEAEDVLADHVGAGPPRAEAGLVGAVADRRDVVRQGVEPDVRDVALVPRQRDAPGDRRAADREVLQAAADEAEGLVALGLGPDEVGVLLVPLEQGLLVLREPEEVVLLAHQLDGAAVDGAVAVDQLGLGVVRLAGHAVEALVRAEVDVAGVVAGLQQLVHGPVVAGLGGADEVVVA